MIFSSVIQPMDAQAATVPVPEQDFVPETTPRKLPIPQKTRTPEDPAPRQEPLPLPSTRPRRTPKPINRYGDWVKK